MKLLLVYFCMLAFSPVAQCQHKRADSCTCTYTIKLSYPDVADNEKLSGTVIVEYDIDSVCVASNPTIIQSLGKAYDDEAVRVAKLMILHNNVCNLRCRLSSCLARKVKAPITFTNSDEE